MNKANIILLVLCLLVIVAGIAVIYEASVFQSKAKVTEGVVDYRLGSSYRVKYSSEDGAEHTLSGSQKNNKYHEGDKIKVFYRTDNPERSRLTDGIKAGKKMIIIAFVVLLLDMYLIYTNRKNSNVADSLKIN